MFGLEQEWGSLSVSGQLTSLVALFDQTLCVRTTSPRSSHMVARKWLT